jgi:glycosyltransferase involved in cell wall biosynthesis
MIRVDIVDPPAYSPPYDHSLAAALARAGAGVRLVRSRFAFGEVPVADGYTTLDHFYRYARGPAGSRSRFATKALEHVPDMLSYHRIARAADIVHLQWLTFPLLDLRLLPRRPTVLTLHDPPGGRATDWPGVLRRGLQRLDAVVVHTPHARDWLEQTLGVDPARVHVIRHGALDYLAELDATPPPELPVAPDKPVVLCFGLIRPYKGIDTLLEAWRGITGAELWIAGRPMMDVAPLQAAAPPGVRFLPRFTSEAEQAALFRAADIVVAPYQNAGRFGFSGVLATALAFGKPIVTTDVGGFQELVELGGARAVPAGDSAALHDALAALIEAPTARAELAAGAVAAAAGPYSWEAAATATLALYETILRR